MLILGEATDEVDERGRRLMGEAILLLTNGGARSRPFTLPAAGDAGRVGRDAQHRASRIPAPSGRAR